MVRTVNVPFMQSATNTLLVKYTMYEAFVPDFSYPWYKFNIAGFLSLTCSRIPVELNEYERKGQGLLFCLRTIQYMS